MFRSVPFSKRGKRRIGSWTTVTLVVLIAMVLTVPMMPANVEAAPAKTINLTNPDGGEDVIGATTEMVTFTTSESGGIVYFTLSTDGGMTYPIEIGHRNNTGGSQSYNWLVSNNLNTSSARLKAEWVSSGIPSTVLDNDTSAANFTITPGIDLRFTEVPSEMSYGRNYLLKWALYDEREQITVVDLQARYQVNGTWSSWTTLSGKYANIDPQQTGIWFMCNYYETANGQLRLRGWDAKPCGSVIAEAESEVFSISSPWIELLTPNGGEVLVGGDTYDITWKTANDPDGIIIGIGIEYSTNSGSSWTNIIQLSPEQLHLYLDRADPGQLRPRPGQGHRPVRGMGHARPR